MMYTYNVKFLTSDDSVSLKNGDFKSYKYETKKKSEESVYDSGKRSFCERRGGHWGAVKPRQLRQLEANFRERTAVYCDWLNESLIGIVFSSGAIAYLSVKPNTLDVTQILFDKYVVGKISGQSVTGVAFCKSHLLFTHTDRTATLITFGKGLTSTQPCRIRDRDPHIQTVELGGSRRTERKISWCETSANTRVLVWGATAVEPAPWSPVLEDHANVHLYQIRGQQMSLIAFHQLENETLCAEISSANDNVIHIVEQTACHKSGVTIEWSRYTPPAAELRATSLRAGRVSRVTCALPAPARCVRRAAARRLLAACIDGTLHVIHASAGLTHSARLGSVATDVRWAGSLLLAAEESGRLQCLDDALAPLPHPAGCPHLPAMLREPRRMHLLATRGGRGGPLVLAAFGGGPLALLRISHPDLITAWVRAGRAGNAVSLLRAREWGEEGAACLRAATALLQGALRGGLRGAGEARAQAALGAFLAPRAPHPPAANKYAPAVHDLARKFFHHLLRRGRIEKALSLCVDLAAWDLCMDARWAAARAGLPAPAAEAAVLAATVAAASHESVCSDSCSQCSSGTDASSCSRVPPPLPRPPPAAIRPNLHQYLDKNDTIWSIDIREPTYSEDYRTRETIIPPDYRRDANIVPSDYRREANTAPTDYRREANTAPTDYRGEANAAPTDYRREANTAPTDYRREANIGPADYRRESNIEVIPRTQDAVHFRHIFQTELREEAPNTLYRYNGYRPEPAERRLEPYERAKPEKNKVKFSDTVTIAVVASEGAALGSVARELADSLPLCAPHNYLAAFAPQPAPPQPPPPPHPSAAGSDYVEV